jgi:molybdopterin molybdotransferase
MALTPVDDALARLLSDVSPVSAEPVALAAANGRILAEDIVARRTQPPFTAAAMDGWALAAADATTPGARLAIVGEAAAGHAHDRALKPGEAVRIFTGAPMPEGADTVVMQEHATREGDVVVLADAAAPGRHVRAAGIDFREGQPILSAGARLDWTNLGLVASANHAEVAVRRRPRVAILATGDELVPPGTTPGPDQIVASNGYGIAALVADAGGQVIDLGIVGDDLAATRAAIAGAFAREIDVLVTLGGASLGDHDLVHRALEAEGVAFDFWKLAMRPGKPLMFGRRGAIRVLGLPGNPAASLVCGLRFVAPLVAALAGRGDTGVVREKAIAGRAMPANDERADHLRASLARDADGRLVATPLDSQDSSLLSRFADADALIVRPIHAPPVAAGETVEIIRLR